MVVPLLVPMNIPYGVTPPVKLFYDTITELPEGSVVAFTIQLIPFNYGDLAPATAAIYNLLMNSPNHLKVVILFSGRDAPLSFDIMYQEYELQVPEWREYGVDWVRLGYYPGMEQGFSLLVDDMKAVYPTDYLGTPYDEIPMLADIKSAADWDVMIEVSSWNALMDYDVRQAYGRYGVPVLFAPAGMTAQSAVQYYPYISKGYIMGIGGAAQLNALLGIKGTLVERMGNSFQFMSLLAFIIPAIGIIGRYMERRDKGG
jgi:hypothetical protein